MSQFLPFRSGEVELLETLFERLSKKSKSIALSDLGNILVLS